MTGHAGEKGMKRLLIVLVIGIFLLAGCGEEKRVTGYGDTSVDWAPITGYTEKQSDAIKKELTERIVYHPPSGDVGTLELWLDKVGEGQYLDTLGFSKEFMEKGYEFVGLDTERHIQAMEMDGNRWLSVTVRALFKQGENTFTYNDSALELMIPVTMEDNGKITLGELYTRRLPASSDLDYYAENNWSRKILNLQMADVTHDGVEDYIVTMIMLPPTADVNSTDINELLYSAGEGYVQVYDGSTEFDPAKSSAVKPIWEEDFAAAVPGHVQISLVQRNGLDYLLISYIEAQQGTYTFQYQVQSLDSEGHEYIIDRENLTFNNNDYATYEQKPLSDKQKQQIAEFKDNIYAWFEGATLLVGIEDVNLVATPERVYTPEEFYDTVWPKYLD